MKRLHNTAEQRNLLTDTPRSEKNRLLKTGGISLLLHTALVIFLIFCLKVGGSNGNGGGGSSVYRVTIHSLSSRSNAHHSSFREVPTSQAVFSKTQIQKTEHRSKEKINHPAVALAATAPESNPRVENEGGQEGSGLGSQGNGTGTGLSMLGLRGFGLGVSSPRYVENPKPDYPLKARQKGYEGKVLLKVEVLPNGRVRGAEVEKSSGYEVLDQSALATVKKWRFIPAKKGRVAILCWVNIPITFQLRDSGF